MTTEVLSPSWWVRDRDKHLAVIQWPNPALIVWIILRGLIASGVAHHRSHDLSYVAAGALIAWSLDELIRGSSPVRRVLGLVVLAGQLLMIAR